MWIPLQIIKVTLSDVDLEYSIGCVHDSITFYDGSEIVDDVIATVCGNHDNLVKYSRSSTVSFLLCTLINSDYYYMVIQSFIRF